MKKFSVAFASLLTVCLVVSVAYAAVCVEYSDLLSDRTDALIAYNYYADIENTKYQDEEDAKTAWMIADAELAVCEAAIGECDVEIAYHNDGLCDGGCPQQSCVGYLNACTEKAGHIYDRDVDPDYTQAEIDAYNAYILAMIDHANAEEDETDAETAYMDACAAVVFHWTNCDDCD